MEFRKNQCIELEITALTAEGMGLGRCQGLVVFVPLTAPGERIRAKLLRVKKHYAYGKMEELLSPAPARVIPDCPIFAQCGGCQLRHITYEEELRAKQIQVRDALDRIGGFPDLPLAPILAAPARNEYRNKALLPLARGKDGEMQMGFYAVNSHRIIDCRERCLLQPEVFHRVMAVFRAWQTQYQVSLYDEESHSGLLRRLYLRWAEAAGQLMACVVINGNDLPHWQPLLSALRQAAPELASFVLNSNRERTNAALGEEYRILWGAPYIEDELCGLRLRLSPPSFYQVNRVQAERLYRLAGEYAGLSGRETVLDLYCGVGSIGLSMAHGAKRLVGVEIVPQAVENARENARRNGIANAEFLCGDAAKAAALLAQRGERPDVVLLDPPRKGCAPELIETAASFGASRIVYVSCDPATLARDLRQFAALGYTPIKAAPVDLFPATSHVETVCLLTHR